MSALRQGIERVTAYFTGRGVIADEGWVVGQAALALGGAYDEWAAQLQPTPAFDWALKQAMRTRNMRARERLWSLRGVAAPPRAALPGPPAAGATPAPPSIALSKADVVAVVELMDTALLCRSWTDEQRARWIDLLARDAHGYRLTHQLLAATLAINQGCLEQDTPTLRHAALASAVWHEQSADGRIDDLGFERMAVLCAAGACGWLPAAWIDALLRAQQPGGSWGVLDPIVEEYAYATESHTAALGFYVLAKTWQMHLGAAHLPPKPSKSPVPSGPAAKP